MGTERMSLGPLGRACGAPADFPSITYIKSRARKALPCRQAAGYECEYSLNDNIYLHCIYSTVAGAVRNSNKVSRRNILTADGVHMLACLSVAA